MATHYADDAQRRRYTRQQDVIDANLPHIFVNACETQAQNLATHSLILYIEDLQSSIRKILLLYHIVTPY